MRLLAIVFLLAVAPSASSSQVIKANDVLLSAMSPFEDMIEFALAGKDSDISKALVAADQHATDVKKVLSGSAASQFATLMESLHRAATNKDHHEVARSAVEEVSLLDYAGFKLRVLAATQRPDWQDIRKTVGEAAGWWKAINPKVSQEGLRNAFDSLIRGLDAATVIRRNLCGHDVAHAQGA